MKMVIFLGPSLDLESARSRLDAIYLPPCAMGDVYNAVERYRPDAVGIIDGYFERVPAVWHKEILHTMERGIPVFGSSSMGALRGAELATYGMRGVGRIFEQYHDGTIEDDDEVAVSHLSPDEGYRVLSDPMVNIRYGLSLAREDGLIEAAEEAALIAEAKALYYPDRTWEALWQGAACAAMPGDRFKALQAFIDARKPDLKAEDAMALLETMKCWAEGASGDPCLKPEIGFEPTIFWEHLCANRASAAPGAAADGTDDLTRDRLVDHVRVHHPERERVLDEALFAHLIQREAGRAGLAAADDRTVLTRFRSDHGLTGAAELRQWMRTHGVSQDECLEMARTDNLRLALRQRYGEAVAGRVPEILKRRGEYARTLSAARDKWRTLHAQGVTDPGEDDVESVDSALAWYQQTRGRVSTPLETHIAELGFASPRQFLAELVAAYLTDHAETRESADDQ